MAGVPLDFVQGPGPVVAGDQLTGSEAGAADRARAASYWHVP